MLPDVKDLDIVMAMISLWKLDELLMSEKEIHFMGEFFKCTETYIIFFPKKNYLLMLLYVLYFETSKVDKTRKWQHVVYSMYAFRTFQWRVTCFLHIFTTILQNAK